MNGNVVDTLTATPRGGAKAKRSAAKTVKIALIEVRRRAPAAGGWSGYETGDTPPEHQGWFVSNTRAG